MSRRLVPYLLLAGLGVLSLAAITVSVRTDKAARIATSSTHRGNPFGAPEYGFGGYSVSELTTQIGAQWRVPAIEQESGDGNASTWIAVQNSSRQFIQIGTTENKVDGVAMYAIFWSDVAVSFHPQQLLDVAPGDLIRFKMVQAPRGWRLSFDDLTQNTPETITVPYAPGSSFFSAQWLQEDPTIGGLANHLPYPSIGRPTFSHLMVNGSAPTLHEVDGQALSTADGVFLVPTLPRDDQFTFTNAKGPARQYLSDVFAYNASLYPYQVDSYYNEPPSKRVLFHIRATLATLQTNLRTQTWPTHLQKAVNGDSKLVADYVKEFNAIPPAPARLSDTLADQYRAVDDRDFHYAQDLRRDLGLPPTH
jgi:hypothetical protein